MTIAFEIENAELILSYSPAFGMDDVKRKLDSNDGILIKHTFWVSNNNLRLKDKDDFEETLRFCIGTVGDKYTRIDSQIINTEHAFFFSNDIRLVPQMFIAYRDISILRKIDSVIEQDLYIGGVWEEKNGLPYDVYMELIRKFPKSAELNKYVNSRIANIIKEYIPEADQYERIYSRYLANKGKLIPGSKISMQIEYEQFSTAITILKEMINDEAGISEACWQERIQNILSLIYPKYILCTREVIFKGVDGYDKRPDFVLVDTNGYVDILEIKKPSVQLITKQASYRNNYVPVKEMSGAIQQIEKYIYCLTSVEKSQIEVRKKLESMLPETVNIDFVNPQGLLIAGRSNEFDAQQKKDFELIKRQYKHIADIMTYDDLLRRVTNIVVSLAKRLGIEM